MTRTRLVRAARFTVVAAGVALGGGCDPTGYDSTIPRGGQVQADAEPDVQLTVHAVQSGSPTREGLAYIRAVASVLTRAEGAQGDARVQLLRRGLALPVPGGLGEAEILRLEMATLLAETLMERPSGAPVARDLLAPMLAVERSLPLDRATARALVALGDASVKTDRDALAAGSYGRAMTVIKLLRQELER